MKDLLSINKTKDIKKYNQFVNNQYKLYDPAYYLYSKILETKDINKKFDNDFIELVYIALHAWNMNTRSAKLNEFEKFKKTLIKNKKIIVELSKYKLENINKNDLNIILKKTKILFLNLKLVDQKKKEEEEPIFVTISKTLHFFIPDLFIPMDRTYTLKFFYNNTYLPKKKENQFKKFEEIYLNIYEYYKYLEKFNIKLKNRWGTHYTKTIDNIIIGYMKKNIYL